MSSYFITFIIPRILRKPYYYKGSTNVLGITISSANPGYPEFQDNQDLSWLERVPDLPVNAPAFSRADTNHKGDALCRYIRRGEQVSMFDQDGFYGRTSRARSRAERRRAKTSGSFWRRYSESVSIPYQFLDLTPGHGDLLGSHIGRFVLPCVENTRRSILGESPEASSNLPYRRSWRTPCRRNTI